MYKRNMVRAEPCDGCWTNTAFFGQMQGFLDKQNACLLKYMVGANLALANLCQNPYTPQSKSWSFIVISFQFKE